MHIIQYLSAFMPGEAFLTQLKHLLPEVPLGPVWPGLGWFLLRQLLGVLGPMSGDFSVEGLAIQETVIPLASLSQRVLVMRHEH